MRASWQSITFRGRGLLVAGVLVAVGAIALGQRDLVRIGLLLVALPLVATFAVTRRDDRLKVMRALDPPRVEVGGTATVRLVLQNLGERRSGSMLVSDHLDPALGIPPHLIVDRIEPGGRLETSYVLDASARGRHQVGPLTLRLEDPFGMVRTSRTTATAHALTVTPVVTALPRSALTTTAGGAADGSARRTAAAGYDDVGTRVYRPGDELRRVHWRATARTGSLMVRLEEEPWEAQALVVVDTRALAHRARATTTAADLDSSSFEWAVHAAASIGTHLAQSERQVRVVAGRTDLAVTGGYAGPLLDALSVIRTDRDGLLVPEGARRTAAPVVVAILGAIDGSDVAAVASLRHTGTRGIAIVLDTISWSGEAPDLRQARLAAPLIAAGWDTVVASRGADLAALWAEVTR